jgi:hypothetical protein
MIANIKSHKGHIPKHAFIQSEVSGDVVSRNRTLNCIEAIDFEGTGKA